MNDRFPHHTRRPPLLRVLGIILVLLPASIFPALAHADQEVDELVEEAREQLDKDPSMSLNLTRQALETALLHNDAEGEAQARLAMGQALEALGGLEDALYQIDLALSYYRASDDANGLAKALDAQGDVLVIQGQYSEAMTAFQSAYDLLRETGDLAGQARSLNNIGRIHYFQDDFDRALEFFERSRQRHEEAGNLEGVGRQLNNIGVIHRTRGDFDKALAAYEESISIRLETGNIRDLAGTYNNIGVIHFSRGDYDESLEWAHRALEVRREIGYRLGEAQSLYNIGRTLADIGRHEEGIEYFMESLAITEKIGALQLGEITHYDLSTLLSDMGRYETSLQHLNQAWDIRSERFDIERQREIEAMSARFETAEQEREIAVLREQQRRDALLRNSAVGGSVLMLALVFLIYRGYRIKSQANKAIGSRNEELSALNRIVVAINDRKEFGQTLATLLAQTVQFLGKADRGVILVLDRDSRQFMVRCTHGYRYTNVDGIALDYRYAMNRYTQGGHEIGEGVYLHRNMPPLEGHERMGEVDPLGSVIAMTITIDERVEGFIVLSSTQGLGHFDAEDAQRFSRIRQHAISAVTKARHLDQLQEENQRAEEAIRRMRLAEEELKHAAMTDLLTGLPNRRYMVPRLQEEQARSRRDGRPFGLILSDIDHFKDLNDTHGHDLGDQVLKHVSQVLRQTLREQDIVCRWGGEEFLIMLPDTNAEGAAFVAEKLRCKLADSPHASEHGELSVTMTFGVADEDGSKDPEARINNADQALYKGKDRGRNCVIRVSELENADQNR